MVLNKELIAGRQSSGCCNISHSHPNKIQVLDNQLIWQTATSHSHDCHLQLFLLVSHKQSQWGSEQGRLQVSLSAFRCLHALCPPPFCSFCTHATLQHCPSPTHARSALGLFHPPVVSHTAYLGLSLFPALITCMSWDLGLWCQLGLPKLPSLSDMVTCHCAFWALCLAMAILVPTVIVSWRLSVLLIPLFCSFLFILSNLNGYVSFIFKLLLTASI